MPGKGRRYTSDQPGVCERIHKDWRTKLVTAGRHEIVTAPALEASRAWSPRSDVVAKGNFNARASEGLHPIGQG